MEISVHKAKIVDLEPISILFNAYRVYYKQNSDTPLAFQFLKNRLEKSQSIIFYAKNEKEDYLGFTQLFPSFSSVSAQRMWILNDLFVSEMARKQGVGQLLLNKAKSFSEETKAKGIVLETEILNKSAQSLYESLDYVKDEACFHYFLKTSI